MRQLGLIAVACVGLWLLPGCQDGPDTDEPETEPSDSRPAGKALTRQEQDERSLDAIAARLALADTREARAARAKKAAQRDKAQDERRRNAIKYHVKNLSDEDPDLRQASAQMLAQLEAFEAVPQIIDALKDEHLYVVISAHGALNRITGRNFGYKNYDDWKRWYRSEGEEFCARGMKEAKRQKDLIPGPHSQGLAHLGNSEYFEAARCFLDQVRYSPAIPDYRNNLGLALMELAREDAWFYSYALEQFAETIRLDPSLPQPYMNAGSCFWRMGRDAEAIYWYRRALELDVNGCLWEYAWTWGKERLAAKEYDLAREFLEQARTKGELAKKQNPYVHRDLALTYYGLGRLRDAWREVGTLKDLGYDMSPEFIAKLESAQPQPGLEHDDPGPPKPSTAP